MRPVHVAATGHSLNYLPEYVASAQGFFAAEGLSVTASVPVPWERVLLDLGSGTAQAVLGGIWLPALFHRRGRAYTAFAQACRRAPVSLLARRPDSDFRWPKLAGTVVAVAGASGAGFGLLTRMLMREGGLEPSEATLVHDLDPVLLAPLFRGGLADYLMLDTPGAAAMEAAGDGHVVFSAVEHGGDVPWSVYYAAASPAEGDPERLEAQTRFCRALGRGMAWLNLQPASECLGFLRATFPSIDPGLLPGLVDTYRAHGMWSTPAISRAAHDRWQAAMARDHLVDAPVPYEALVDPLPAS